MRKVKLSERKLHNIINNVAKMVLRENNDKEWHYVNEVYYTIGKHIAKIKLACEKAYKSTKNQREKMILDACWDNASHIELMLSDPEYAETGGYIGAIESGSNTYHTSR